VITSRDPAVPVGPQVIVFPGFTRTSSHLTLFIRELEQRHFEAVAITIASRLLPFMYMSKPHLRRVSVEIARKYSGREIVLIGHSAGAASATYIAHELQLMGIEITGLIFADGVDSPNHLISTYLPGLGKTEIAAILAPPSPCNRNGLLAKNLYSYPDIDMQIIPDAGHGDIEGAGISIYRKICKDQSSKTIAWNFREAIIRALEKISGQADHFN
jgi:hypothetical protein